MAESFRVTGVNPATGEVVMLSVYAETAMDAKAHVESCGLMHVIVNDGGSAAPVLTALPYWLRGAEAAGA